MACPCESGVEAANARFGPLHPVGLLLPRLPDETLLNTGGREVDSVAGIDVGPPGEAFKLSFEAEGACREVLRSPEMDIREVGDSDICRDYDEVSLAFSRSRAENPTRECDSHASLDRHE